MVDEDRRSVPFDAEAFDAGPFHEGDTLTAPAKNRLAKVAEDPAPTKDRTDAALEGLSKDDGSRERLVKAKAGKAQPVQEKSPKKAPVRAAKAPSSPPKAVSASAEHSPAGHRSRLRHRLLTGGDEALADYEVLEYVLYGALPRKDTKPLAKTLLECYGSLSAVLNAEPSALRTIPGLGETGIGALKITALAARRMARTEVEKAPILSSWHALLDYLTIDMAHLSVERVRVLYLNSHNRLILDHHVGDGSVDEAPLHPREVIRRALNIGAVALIVAHNHPSGNAEPSRADIQITRQLIEAGRLLGVKVHDHVIISRQGSVSLRQEGLI